MEKVETSMTSSSVDHKKEQVEPAKMMTWSEEISKESAEPHFYAIFVSTFSTNFYKFWTHHTTFSSNCLLLFSECSECYIMWHGGNSIFIGAGRTGKYDDLKWRDLPSRSLLDLILMPFLSLPSPLTFTSFGHIISLLVQTVSYYIMWHGETQIL